MYEVDEFDRFKLHFGGIEVVLHTLFITFRMY